MSTYGKITESLTAPGVVMPPAGLSPGAQAAHDLLGALDSVGDAAGAFARFDAAEKRRKAVEDAHAAQTDDGLASQQAATWLPDIERQIAEGSLKPGDDTKAQVEALVGAALNRPDFSANYRQSFAARVTGPLARALETRKLNNRNEAAYQILQTLSWSLDTAPATVPTGIEGPPAPTIGDVMAEARRLVPNATEDQLVTATLIPALDRAADAGDESRVRDLLTALPARYATVRQRVTDRADERATKSMLAAQAAAVDQIIGAKDAGAPYEELTRQVDFWQHDRGLLGNTTAAKLRADLLADTQQSNATALRRRILNGTITPDEVLERVQAASNHEPTDPRYIDPAIGQSIADLAANQRRVSLAQAQVADVLAGAPGSLTEAQHGNAMAAAVGPTGFGYIDTTNRIANPVALTAAILRARMNPPEIRQTLIANLTSPDNADKARAAAVIGAIGNASPQLYARLWEDAGPTIQPMLDAAKVASQRGQFRDDNSAAKAIAEIDRAATATQSVPRPPTEVIADINESKRLDPTETLDNFALDALQNVRASLPWSKDYALGIDWLNPDPTLDSASNNIRRRVESWYAAKFTALRDRLPRGIAMREAQDYAEAQIKNNIDFVRWQDTVTPVAIDLGQGLRLPEHMRWGDGFEEEAARDLAAAGFHLSNVAALRPFVSPTTTPGQDPTAHMGWQFIDSDGDPITNEQGQLVIFRPTDKAAAAAAKLRAELDWREMDFRASAAVRHINIEDALRPDPRGHTPRQRPDSSDATATTGYYNAFSRPATVNAPWYRNFLAAPPAANP